MTVNVIIKWLRDAVAQLENAAKRSVSPCDLGAEALASLSELPIEKINEAAEKKNLAILLKQAREENE